MQRAVGVTAIMSVGEGVHVCNPDLEAQHEAEEADICALLRKIESLEAELRHSTVGKASGDPSVPEAQNRACESSSRPGRHTHLSRLTEYKNKQGGVSSVLAWDDLTGMKLEAGKVVEARAKEVGYIRDKRVYTKIF